MDSESGLIYAYAYGPGFKSSYQPSIINQSIIYLSQATWPIHRNSHTRTQYTITQKKEK